jgi:hypothetical protein
MVTTIVGVVALGVLSLLVVIGVVARLVLHGMKAPLEARIAKHYRRQDILLEDLGANSFGRQSAGVWQLRGNGGLVLTNKTLHFFMFLPKKEVCIPLETISELSIVNGHLGKITSRELLKVHFSADGKPDSIAWYLADPRAWKARIEQLTAAQPIA